MVNLILSDVVDVIAFADVVRPEPKWREVFGIEHKLQGCRTHSTWHFYDRMWNGHQLDLELLPSWILDCV
jgi:hypothetical protein